MAEFHGITVIDDDTPDQQSTDLGIGITAIVRIKHAALYEAAKVLGSASALARHLGIHQADIGRWINLKACPPKEPTKWWPEERIAIMEAKLYQLTGKSWEELWPDELRNNHEFLGATKSIEQVYNWKESAMLHYADATRQRLLSTSIDDTSPQSLQLEAIERNVHLLTKRERKIISGLFGFGDKKTSGQLGKELNISTTAVHQVKDKALAKLRHFSRLSLATVEAGNPHHAKGHEPISVLQMPRNIEDGLIELGFTTVQDFLDTDETKLNILGVKQYWIYTLRNKMKSIGLKLLDGKTDIA